MKKIIKAKAPAVIAGFGASTLQGFCDYSHGGFMTRLQLWYCNEKNKRRVFNLGIGGDTTVDMVRRIKGEIEEREPELVILLLGGNDFPRANDSKPGMRSTLAQYKKNLETMFKTLTGKKILFLTSYAVDTVKTGISYETCCKYMDCAKKVAAKYKADIIDVHALLKYKMKPSFMAPDGVHFNSKGHAWLFGLIKHHLSVRYDIA
ncbi:MAG: SGNH/GDSL hydrolase family protein [Fibrobacteres bacterium]|nr:SGNH/GDSL hydrolase family protein [Fibrobacterota bacterium]